MNYPSLHSDDIRSFRPPQYMARWTNLEIKRLDSQAAEAREEKLRKGLIEAGKRPHKIL